MLFCACVCRCKPAREAVGRRVSWRQTRQVIEAEAAPRMAERASRGEKRQMAARMRREGRMEGGRL